MSSERINSVGLLILICITLKYNNAFVVKMTNLVCESYNKSWVVFKECRLYAISRNKTTLTAWVDILEPVYNVFVKFKILKKANGYKPWLVDYTIDGCKFMRRRYHPVAKIVRKLIRGVSTLNHSCPFVGLNGVKNFYLVETLPYLMLPTGDYLLTLNYSFDNKPIFVTDAYFSFIE